MIFFFSKPLFIYYGRFFLFVSYYCDNTGWINNPIPHYLSFHCHKIQFFLTIVIRPIFHFLFTFISIRFRSFRNPFCKTSRSILNVAIMLWKYYGLYNFHVLTFIVISSFFCRKDFCFVFVSWTKLLSIAF